jgi:hypothetical protein
MNITLFRLEQGRLVYGDENFVYFEPQPRFTINRNQNKLLLAVGNDDEISIDLKSVTTLLGFESEKQCVLFLCDNYFLQDIKSNADYKSENTNNWVTPEDEEMVRLALADFTKKVNQ